LLTIVPGESYVGAHAVSIKLEILQYLVAAESRRAVAKLVARAPARRIEYYRTPPLPLAPNWAVPAHLAQ
jgi:hypothetical protein